MEHLRNQPGSEHPPLHDGAWRSGVSNGLEAQAAGSPWKVSLPQFEGPLDLLLHLVRSNDMDILDIKVETIAKQYNAFLDSMRSLDLEIASDYLVMAATLAHIKSRLMVPPEPSEDWASAEDPRAELTRQLLEFERYRRMAEELGALEEGRDLIFVRPGPPPEEFAGAFTMRVDLDDLVAAFQRVLERLEASDGVELIRREEFRIQDMMARLIDLLDGASTVSFRAVLSACRTRLERVVAFLALLELMRIGAVDVWQAGPREEITVTSLGAPGPDEEVH